MGIFSNPLAYVGGGPGITGTPTTQNSTVRAATAAEAAAGTLTNVYISPATAQSATALDFASPPVLGYGSTTPRPVAATTLTASGNSSIGTGASSVVNIGSGASSTIGFFGATAVAKPASTDDLRTALINLGLYTTGGASPLNLNGGALTTGNLTATGTVGINTSGAGVTTIGTGGTGATNIGNATGNTAVTGSLTTTTSLTATLGNITATNGNIVRGTAGNKDVYTSVASTTTAGANSAGKVTLVGGTATVSTTAVTASSLIRLTRQSVGATGANDLGILSVGTIVAATSFVINAWTVTNATALQTDDVSEIFWEIVN